MVTVPNGEHSLFELGIDRQIGHCPSGLSGRTDQVPFGKSLPALSGKTPWSRAKDEEAYLVFGD